MLIGVDIGTSVTKAVAFDDAAVLATEAQPTELSRPRPGWYEQDVDDVVASVGAVVRRLLARVDRTPEAIGLTGQGDGVWLADADGRAPRPAISWMDGRATEIVRRWMADGVVDELFRRNGGVIFPGCPAPILAWLEAEEPDVLARAATAGYCTDVVMQRITGVRATDLSHASLPFLNQQSLDQSVRSYDEALLELCGLGHRKDLLAPIVAPTPSGRLDEEGARLLGAPVGTPVTAGPFDLAASALGSGVTGVGAGHVIVGTTLACQVLVDRVDTGGEPSGLTIARPDGTWLRALPTMVGTAALDWVLGFLGEPHERVDALLGESPPGARGVECLPYFSASGERAPFVEPAARARFDGLTVHAEKADLVRATCEAIAYAGRHCLEAAGLTKDVTVCGGGARSSGWLQIFADVLGRPVRVAEMAEAGAYGAALTARAHLTGDDPGTALAERTVQPNAALADHYAQGYSDYLAAVDVAREGWRTRTAERRTAQ